ncbi:LicD family protein [Enorma phocaeensis]|uniref:LicD family protein n=1 Tax=Enorma phocaeensis TaxID=1871019 RepID=UPI0023558ED8|nr:LicD family protein [Enorma phocaeensis]
MNQGDALKKLQGVELDILKAFASFCDENNLTWFLDSGSVLGAIRHKGFIPWDDDIDVGMLRKDYDRFLDLAGKQFVEGYSVHTADNTQGFAGMFAKIYKDGTLFDTAETLDAGLRQGIFIDVFPYDYLASSKITQLRQRFGAKIWQSISYLMHSSHIVVPHKGILGAIEVRLCRCAHFAAKKLFSSEMVTRRFLTAVRCDSNASSRLLPFAWPNIEGIPETTLVPVSHVEFEGLLFPCPAKAIEYLEQMYGDWKVIPTPEDQKTHMPLLIVFDDGTYWKS